MRMVGQTRDVVYPWYGAQSNRSAYRPKRKKSNIADAVWFCIEVYIAFFSMIVIAHVLW